MAKEKLKLFLIKIQADEGTPEVSLDGANFFWVFTESKLDNAIAITELDLTGDGYDQINAVVGMEKGNTELIAPLRNYGDGVTPEIDVAMQAAGFDLTTSVPYYIYTPSDTNRKSCTVWCYSGNKNAGDAVLEKLGNTKFDWKLDFDFSGNMYGRITFTGDGRYIADPSDDSHPAVTVNRTNVPSLKGSSLTINGSTNYRVVSLGLAGNQPISTTPLFSDPTGVGITGIDEKKIKFTTKVYLDKVATIAPIAALKARTEGLLDFSWGTGPLAQITGNYSQITKCTKSTEGGFQTWDIEGQLNRNDFELKLRGATI